MRAADVVVVGGGVVGWSIAWRAAGRGLDVVVVDDAPGRGATHAAAGMLAPVTEAHFGEEPLLALNLASAAAWPGFAADLERATGRPCGYRACGTLVVAADADDNRAIGVLYDFQVELGLDVTRLRSAACREMEPLLARSVRGGVLVAGDHQVDPRVLLPSLAEAAEGAGVRAVRQRARAVRTGPDGGVAGVELADGEALDAGHVVVAAGCWSRDLAGIPEIARPPVRPVKGQIVTLRATGPGDPLPARTVRAMSRGRSVYLVPRVDGRLVLGATVEEQGFDTRVTAGAIHELLNAAVDVVPSVAELEVVETMAGLRPGTPDNAPLIGPTPVPGLVLATGHYRNGVLLAPVTADAVAELLTTGHAPELVLPFAPDRFRPVAQEVPRR